MPHTLTAPTLRTTSFRDPVGRVVLVEDRCFRVMTPKAGLVLEEFLATEVAQRGIVQGKLVATRKADSIPEELLKVPGVSDWPDKVQPSVFEHEAINFPNYPYEWPAAPTNRHPFIEIFLLGSPTSAPATTRIP